MADINLLPEELRDKEKKELAAERKAKEESFKLAQPINEPEPGSTEKTVKPSSRWGGLFTKKKPASTDNLSTEQTDDLTAMFKPASTEPVRFKQRLDPAASSEALPPIKSKPVPLPPPPITKIQPAPAIGETELSKQLSAVTNQYKPEPAKPSWFARRRQAATPPSQDNQFSGGKHQPAAGNESSESSELDVNLIPAELASGQDEKSLAQRLKRSGMFIILAIAAVGAAYGGILWYNMTIARQIEAVNQSIQQLDTKIIANEAAKVAAVDLQQRLKLINDLLHHHVYWTQFFAALEQHTIDEVYYTNFAMAGTTQLTLSAVGRDYASVARQLVAFEEASNFVASAEVNSALAALDDTGNYEQVSFTINLTLQPQVFLQSFQ